MDFIIHRVNTIKKLKKIPSIYGCEIDIRTDGSDIILSHDPFNNGDKIEDFLDNYKNGTLILNIKESGIEKYVIDKVEKRQIKNFFLLDVEFPYMYQSAIEGNKNVAVRFSEFEPAENLLYFQNKLDWVWIDTINNLPVNKSNIKVLNKYKSCLVCPSRWGRSNEIGKTILSLKKLNFDLDYVMTELKYINKWIT